VNKGGGGGVNLTLGVRLFVWSFLLASGKEPHGLEEGLYERVDTIVCSVVIDLSS
jgi:hypothetical protein